MDELPREARDFLALVKDAHDPSDPTARARVEARLTGALSAAAATSSLAQLSPRSTAANDVGRVALGSSLSQGKVLLAGLMLALAGAGLYCRQSDAPQVPTRSDAPVQRAELPEVAPQPVLEPLPAPSAAHEPQPGAAPRSSALASASPTPTTKARRVLRAEGARPPTEGSLAEEAALLARASEQLEQRNAGAAALLLAEHTRRFPNAQLREEREGFALMVRCIQRQPSAHAAAETFVAERPTSVLLPRLRRACEL